MEEEKAAAYYDELLRKGGGAARFKQGLGYGAPSTDAPNSSHPSSCNFVKARSPGNELGAIEKEIRLANVRDKLKKRDGIENRGRQDPEERQALRRKDRRSVSPERDDQRSGRRSGASKVRRRRHFRSRSRDRDRPSRTERERKHRYQSRSSSREDNRASSYTSSGQSHDRSHRTREKSRRARSRSSGSSSDYRSRKVHRKRVRRRSRSGSRRIKPSSRRSRSLSSSISSEDHRHSHRDSAGNHRSSNHRHRSRSPNMGRKEKSKHRKDEKIMDRHVAKKGTACDYAKIIPGFDSMTPAERVKAKMKLQLSETVVKDSAKGMSGEWERFDFNKEAPLDDDAKLDYFGDGIGARDDTGFLQNTGSTFMSSHHQARREAQIQEAHDAAIFGAPVGAGKVTVSKGHDSSSFLDVSARVQLETNPPTSNLLSDQVLAMQQGSWRERALKLKEQRAARPSI